MEIVPLGPGFAAELRGVTLAEVTADDAAYAAARAAFEEHSVLVFRGQEVTDECQLAFSRRFGPPEVTKVGSQGTGTHFVILSTIGEDGKVVPADHRLAIATKPTSFGIRIARSNAFPRSHRRFRRASFRRAAVKPNMCRPALPSSASTGPAQEIENSFAWHDYAHSRGRIMPDLASPGSAQSYRRNAGALRGRIRRMAAAHSISPRTPTRSKAWSGPWGKADRRADGRCDSPGDELRAQLARRRRRHVGQPRDHASRTPLASA